MRPSPSPVRGMIDAIEVVHIEAPDVGNAKCVCGEKAVARRGDGALSLRLNGPIEVDDGAGLIQGRCNKCRRAVSIHRDLTTLP